MTTLLDVYNFLDEIAPFKNQDKYDNSGIIIGEVGAEVRKILICLDVAKDAIDEAKSGGYDLIISHHPPVFEPLKQILKDSIPYLLISNNIFVISAHTNLDVAKDGVTDEMLKVLGFPKSDIVIEVAHSDGSGYGKIVELETAITARELAEKAKTAFNCSVVKYVDGKKPIKKIGVQSGSGNPLVESAFKTGCDAFICGDIKWDRFVFAKNYGFTLIDVGHFHSEDIICRSLRERLKERFPDLTVEKAKSADLCDYV